MKNRKLKKGRTREGNEEDKRLMMREMVRNINFERMRKEIKRRGNGRLLKEKWRDVGAYGGGG